MLKLSARIVEQGSWLRIPDEGGPAICISVNGTRRGVVYAKTEEAAELVALLNAATELLEIARRAHDNPCTCHMEMTQHKPCLSCAARHVLSKAKGAT